MEAGRTVNALVYASGCSTHSPPTKFNIMNKKEYKIGDKVRIKNIKSADSDLYIFGINQDMERYANKILTIDDIAIWQGISSGRIVYKMKEDKHCWNWSTSMFVPFTKGFIDLKTII